MHFQRPPHAEAKFITCLQGCIWDVAVDLRRGSPTFLQWRAFELSPDNQQSLLIPEGCAHGFQALTEACEMLYVHSEFFAPDADDGVNPNDPMLDISWPLPVSGLSDKDARRPFLSHDFEGMTL
jgi:dTDP-4-dehydrorhamnose 3,5-epimerase